MRGDGRLYREPGSPYWWMAYYVNGRQYRASTHKTDEEGAGRVLQRRVDAVRGGDAVPNDQRVTLTDLFAMLATDYAVNKRRWRDAIGHRLRPLRDYFGAHARAVTLTSDRLQAYAKARLDAGAATATVRYELALLGRAFTLAVRARRLRTRPYIPMPALDPSAVRQGFVSRAQLDTLCRHLAADLADFVRFLFFSAWRPVEVRTLEWRDYDRAAGTIRLRPEHSKTKHPRELPVDTGELVAVLERRVAARKLHLPWIFHGHGRRIGDCRKA